MASSPSSSAAPSVAHRTYLERIPNFSNAAARSLLETIVRKRSNLCVSVDVTTKRDLLDVVEAVGGICCAVKTHIDIVEDFDQDLVDQLTALSQRLDFLIFEDRKFADIGNTVTLQYSSGVHKISSWSHITNAHLVPGPGIIAGLRKAGEPLGRGLLLLAEMSSKGNLAQGDYTRACVREAKADDFVIGFIAMHRVDEDEAEKASGAPFKDFLILTPGVGLVAKGDALGQQYRTPDEVVRQSGCDVIIVGRGIYGALLQPEAKAGAQGREQAFTTVKSEAERYKEEGWKAYERRVAEARGGDAPLEEERKRLSEGVDRDDMPGLYREDGSFDIFGYGSLIFKPPPNTTKRTVGFIKGYARRFAQSSIDHRGTPASPGRVVTLVTGEDWRAGGGTLGEEGDIVWGVSWTIDPAHAGETKRYLDWREKNGYTPTLADIWGHNEKGAEVILARSALIYVGLPTNPAYIGPEPLPKLAATIATARGPSGPNYEYVYELAEATRALAPEVQDSHLFGLEEAVRQERQRLGLETGTKTLGIQESVRADVEAQAESLDAQH